MKAPFFSPLIKKVITLVTLDTPNFRHLFKTYKNY